jgi:hypothetical protein
MTKQRKLFLTAQISFFIVTPARHGTAESFAAQALENTDNAGDNSTLLDVSPNDMLPSTIPLPDEIPTPRAWRIPSNTRDHTSVISLMSAPRCVEQTDWRATPK